MDFTGWDETSLKDLDGQPPVYRLENRFTGLGPFTHQFYITAHNAKGVSNQSRLYSISPASVMSTQDKGNFCHS